MIPSLYLTVGYREQQTVAFGPNLPCPVPGNKDRWEPSNMLYGCSSYVVLSADSLETHGLLGLTTRKSEPTDTPSKHLQTLPPMASLPRCGLS